MAETNVVNGPTVIAPTVPVGAVAVSSAAAMATAVKVQVEVTPAQRAILARLVDESRIARGTQVMAGIHGSIHIVPTPAGANPAMITEALAKHDFTHANYLLTLESWNPVLSSLFLPADKPPSPPPPRLQEIGPINWNPIVFDGGVPVGGWAQLALFPNGAINFVGNFHDSGFWSYNDSIVFAVQAIATGDVFMFSHQGHMAGTIESGSRDDGWNSGGQAPNAALAGAWSNFSQKGYRWWANAGVNWDINSVISDLKAVISAVQTIASVVSLVF